MSKIKIETLPDNNASKKKIELGILKEMKGIKRVQIWITFDMETHELMVKFRPRTRFDAQLILGMIATAYQWLLNDFIRSGKLKTITVLQDKIYLDQMYV